MLKSAFELGENLNNRTIKYYLYKPIWEKFAYPDLDLTFEKWTTIKYLNDDATDFGPDIHLIPNDKGGLYLFFVRCSLIKGLTDYPLYIGRAQYTNGQNLRKRVKEYYQLFYRNSERPKITRMINYWGPDLYLSIYPLDENDAIRNVEHDIINSTLFEMNDKIPDTEISQAVKAF